MHLSSVTLVKVEHERQRRGENVQRNTSMQANWHACTSKSSALPRFQKKQGQNQRRCLCL